MEDKSPVRVAIERYLADFDKDYTFVDHPEMRQWFRDVIVDIARVATEQEYDRCIKALRENRPILSRYNKWHEIIKRT